MKRKIYNNLLEWKNNETNKKPLMVLGVSTKPFGYDPKKKIKSIPLYAVFCLKKDI